MIGRSPTIQRLRAWTGEPFLDLSPAAIELLFADQARADDVRTFLSGVRSFGSSRGVAHLWEAARHRHGPAPRQPVFARLSAILWAESKRASAVDLLAFAGAPFGAHDLLSAMSPFRASEVLMSVEELAAFAALPDPVQLRRVSRDEERRRDPYCWTPELGRTGFQVDAAPGADAVTFVTRLARKADVVACFGHSSDVEVVLLTPGTGLAD